VHSIFRKFRGYSGTTDPHIWIDWIGARFPRRLIAPFPTLEAEEFSHPACSEEYFEWIDLLATVETAEHRFAMIELGAGFGRWGIRGAVAARQRGIPKIDIRLVEAEPQHAEWARECIALNALSDVVTVTEAALSYQRKLVPFELDPGFRTIG
jgi:predicted O-methyltransferase YrrM